jgi:16S rRNA (uracil1498-N3)-methyltransferase
MKPRRFFVEDEPLRPGELLLSGKRAHHLTRVLRLRVGEPVELFDGSGREFPAEILEVGRQLIRFKVCSGKRVDRESPLNLMLALGISRPSIMDLIVQKATELGVNEIVPIQTERAQGWLSGKKDLSRIKRWGRIAQEAARQSGRNVFPRIWPLTDYLQLLQQTENKEVKLFCWEEEKKESLRQALEVKGRARQACVLIGPEGGFSEKEAEEAASAGFQSVSLGRRILRTETAAILVIGLVQYELGDLSLWS